MFVKKVQNQVLGHSGCFSFWVMNWVSSLYLCPTKCTVALQLTVVFLFFPIPLSSGVQTFLSIVFNPVEPKLYHCTISLVSHFQKIILSIGNECSRRYPFITPVDGRKLNTKKKHTRLGNQSEISPDIYGIKHSILCFSVHVSTVVISFLEVSWVFSFF